MSQGLMFALVCGLVAVGFGAMWTKGILSLPDGNDRMRAIAAAIQQGAEAYLNRQYRTIAMVGVVLLIVVGIFVGWMTAAGFFVGTRRARTSSLSKLHGASILPPCPPPHST